MTSFESTRGSSNNDLTVVSDKMVTLIGNLKISDMESCSDHQIITFDVGNDAACAYHHQPSYYGIRYVVRDGDLEKFDANILREIAMQFLNQNDHVDGKSLDKELYMLVREGKDIEINVEKLYEAIKNACKKSFKTCRIKPNSTAQKSVPWWISKLTIMRSRVNAMRKKYQRTKGNSELREIHKRTYLLGKNRV